LFKEGSIDRILKSDKRYSGYQKLGSLKGGFMRQIAQGIVCFIFALVFFAGCKTQKLEPVGMGSVFIASFEDCPIEQSINRTDFKTDQNTFVEIPKDSIPNVTCASRFAISRFKSLNPNRDVTGWMRAVAKHDSETVTGVVVYSRPDSQSLKRGESR